MRIRQKSLLSTRKRTLSLDEINKTIHLQVFTDGSVNPHLKVGYGAYLVVTGLIASIDSLKKKGESEAFR